MYNKEATKKWAIDHGTREERMGVDCPDCGAKAGEVCRGKRGVRWSFHAGRLSAFRALRG